MCTILTVSREAYGEHILARMNADAVSNNDGWGLVLWGPDGATTVLRTLDYDLLQAVMRGADWHRMFLHARMATQGKVSVSNTHGWDNASGVFWMHNGILQHPAARHFPVDSQLIGQWLLQGGVDMALDHLFAESFANVFLIDTVNKLYAVHRSYGGSLYTDGRGNYSSRAVGRIKRDVPVGFEFHELPGEQHVVKQSYRVS